MIAMFDDDLPKKANNGFPRILDDMSVAELIEYIAEMQAEITRVQADIEKKQASANAADAFFK